MVFERIGRIALPPWMPWAVVGGVAAFSSLMASVFPPPPIPNISVAFIGNSMQYYNDFPRFMEALSDNHVAYQNSCLHGDASLSTITVWGNGMYKIWGGKGSARIYDTDTTLFDYGACTIPQLLFGYDSQLDSVMQDGDYGGADDDNNNAYNDDFYSYNDGKNPCYKDSYYYGYLDLMYSQQLDLDGPPKFDFVVLNDNTRSPARLQTREISLDILESKYVDWFLESGAIPVFLCTYAYSTPYRDMGKLSDVGEFTSYTYEGYRLYAELLEKALPSNQKPRIAPVALAFLTVYEENYGLWTKLFHVDQIHASPLGTFLQGCVVHYTLFGKMPLTSTAIGPDQSVLYQKVRRFQPGEHRRTPFPTQDEARYLYDVAVRVCKHNHKPKSFRFVDVGDGADYTPNDDLFRIDDLF